MPDSADQHLPPPAGPPRMRSWPRCARYAARAVFELVLARVAFSSITVPAIQARNAASPNAEASPATACLLAWITYTLPRVAHRMPFRADCLVQALAAQRWLAAYGIGSRIVIGGERPGDRPFAAHAWLVCGSQIVTGGETEQYTVLI